MGCKAVERARAVRPLLWWEIAASGAGKDRLPFMDYFDEVIELDPMDVELEEDEETVDLIKNRIVEPVIGWQALKEATWGGDDGLIEEWFDAGEALAQGSDLELHIEEPDRWERAVQWMRSLALTART